MTWRDAVLQAILRQVQMNGTFVFTNKDLENNQLFRIVSETGSIGETPARTLARVLQEIRDEGLLIFNSNKKGVYEFLGEKMMVNLNSKDSVQLSQLELIKTTEGFYQQKVRIGQGTVRRNALTNYQSTCAFCSICELDLLVASHIVRWADEEVSRLKPDNVLCLCSQHDALFEKGYIGLSPDYELIINEKRKPISKGLELWLKECPSKMIAKPIILPNPKYLELHLKRIGI